tara:strand:- start:284 stop:412 length:129 start_codon:yes stop_codon:yes gene_type:complete
MDILQEFSIEWLVLYGLLLVLLLNLRLMRSDIEKIEKHLRKD